MKNNLTKVILTAIVADTVVTTVAAIRSHCLVRKHEAEKQNHKPEVKMGHDIVGDYLPLIIPSNSMKFVEKAVKAFSNLYGFDEPDNKKIKNAMTGDYWDFYYHDTRNEEGITVYAKDEKSITFVYKEDDAVTVEFELTIISDGESEDDRVIRTKITRSNYPRGNSEFYVRSYDHKSFKEALSVPEFRFLKVAFEFKLVPSVEYNN